MGTFQSGINNILAATAVAATAIKKGMDETKAAKAVEEAKAAEEAEAEAKKVAEEEQSIASTTEKLSDARMLAVGYTQKDLRKQKAAKELGIDLPQKNPRGVSNTAFDRRMANAKAMEEIHTKYIQKADFRKRIEGLKTSDIAEALKPEIRAKKKKEVNEGGEK